MFIPAVAVLLVGSATNERIQIDWNRCPVKYIPLALLLLPVIMHVAMVPVVVAYERRYGASRTPRRHGMTHSGDRHSA